MTHTPHEIYEEFPEYQEKIHMLKIDNPHFLKLFNEYHEVNRKIHRVETNIEPMEDLAHGELRKKRLILKDEISKILNS